MKAARRIFVLTCFVFLLGQCSQKSQQDEITRLLSGLPESTIFCVIAKDFQSISIFHQEYGPAFGDKMRTYFQLPIDPGNLKEIQQLGIAPNSPAIFAKIEGDPRPGPEEGLLLLPVQNRTVLEGAIRDYTHVFASVIQETPFILGASKRFDKDRGAAEFIEKDLLAISFYEGEREKPGDPASIISNYRSHEGRSFSDAAYVKGILEVIPEDWFILILSINKGEKVRAGCLTKTVGDEGFFYEYDGKWYLMVRSREWLKPGKRNVLEMGTLIAFIYASSPKH